MTKFLQRESTYPIENFFLSRFSARALSEERLTEEELMSLFEAARWAPSSYNNQPWRYLYARRGDPAWDTMYKALIDWNKTWCATADTLIVVISRNNFEHNNKPSVTARFDTGASWMSLAIEAHARHLIAHGMQGFNYDEIRQAFHIPDTFTVEAMVAIGKPGDPNTLPPEMREKEVLSQRKPLEQIASRDVFSFT
jgi:nitroreductase